MPARMRSAAWAFLASLAFISAPPGALAQKTQRDVITRKEILSSSLRDQDLLTVIKALRPHFLQTPRGTPSLKGTGTTALSVYVDRIRQPGTDDLRRIAAPTVEEVRYLDPSRSQNEYGLTANGGAIVIKLVTLRKNTERGLTRDSSPLLR